MGAGTHLLHIHLQTALLLVFVDNGCRSYHHGARRCQGHQVVPNSIEVHSRALWEMSLRGWFGPRFLRGLGILLIAAILWDPLVGRL